MRVKKFEAKSMKEALQMVKNDLGPDAVILAARDNRKSFGLVGEGSVEVTAAVSEHTLHKKKFVESRMTDNDRSRFQQSAARTQKQFIDKMADRRIRQNERDEAQYESAERQQRAETSAQRRPITSVSYIDIPDEELTIKTRPATPRAKPALPKRPPPPHVDELLADEEDDVTPNPSIAAGASRALSRIRNAAQEAWNAGLLTVEEPVKAKPAVSPAPTVAGNEIDVLKNEIQRLQQLVDGFKQVPQTFVTAHPGADYGLNYDLSPMFQKLTEAGIAAENAVEILNQCQREMDPLQIKKPALVDAAVARWFLNHIRVTQNPLQPRIQLFMGGAGSGKTSTLVKIASQLVVKEKKRVAVLTTDSFKVGAVDQLKIYCQILNVPFAIIRNRAEWEWVISQLSTVDHILVDYPGLQLRDLDEIHLLKALLPPPEMSAVAHMVVNTTAKDGDSFEVCRRYKVANLSDLIFTNLDQSVQHGVIYNTQKLFGLPLHSFGIGNRIPEDFELATKERVLDLIFKLTKIRRGNK